MSNENTKFLAEIAYNAYSTAAGGKSLVNGDPLPAFNVLKTEVQEAWGAAANAVRNTFTGQQAAA